MTSSPAGIAGVFDRAADTYDAVGVPWFGPIAAGLVEELAVQPGERVRDIGCRRGAPFASDEGMEQLLRDVRTAKREVTAGFTDPQPWQDFSWSHGQRAMWEAIPAERQDHVRDDLIAVLSGFDELNVTQQVRHTLGRRP